MLTILMGRANTGKSAAILNEIRSRGDAGRQLLLVPEHASHQAEVDLARACGDGASRHAEVLSFRRLAERVLSRTGGAAQVTLDAGGKLLTLQRCLTELAPELTVYRRPSRRAGFLKQLLDLFDEFQCYRVTAEELGERAGAIGGATGQKLRDLSLLFAAYTSRLTREGRDGRDLMSKLCDRLEESGYGAGKDVYLDGFTYFNAQERRVLEILLRQADSLTVTLLGEEGDENFDAAGRTLRALREMARDAGAEVSLRLLRKKSPGPLGHLERFFFGEAVPYEGPCEALHLREAEGILAEVEQTAAAIRRLTACGEARYRDITVAARNMEDYEETIENVFERWEIPVYLNRRSDILEKPVLSLLTGVLASVTGGYEYEDMFRWLKTGLAGLTAEECDLLENYVLRWEIHGGMWIRDTDWTEHPEGYGQEWDEGDRARLAALNDLRRRVRAPLAALAEGLEQGRTARAKVEALYDFMERLDLQNTLEGQMYREAQAGRLQAAEETGQLWEILCSVLDQFVEILGEDLLDTDEFFRLFRLVATQYSVGTIPVSLDQVSVSAITRNDRHTVKYLFLLGANDHVLPTPGTPGGVLNDDDRLALQQQGVELAPSGMAQLSVELQNLYAAMVQPTRGLTVSYPLTGLGAGDLRPAFIVPRLLELFPELRIERSRDRSYRLTAPLPALEAAGSHPGGALWRYFESQPEAAGKLKAMERAASLERGRLSRPSVRLLYGERAYLSASRVERIRWCHFAFFMEYGLRARTRKRASFDAPQMGTFLHYLLENVAREAETLGGFSRLEPQALRTLTEEYMNRYAEEKLQGLRGKSARFRYLFNRLRTTAQAIVEEAAEELRHSDFVPLAFELSFGPGRDVPGVTISTPETAVSVGGTVDRVDGWVRDGKLYLRVIDYKSGKKQFSLGAVRMGMDLQMLLYLFTLQKKGSGYFHHDIEPAGVLYVPARDSILSAERNILPEDLEAKRQKELRRSGLVLSQPEVLTAMEHEALEGPRFLPLNLRRDGSVEGSLASAAQLGKLGQYVEKLLGRISRELGNIDADPWRKGPESACDYCAWKSACGFRKGRDRPREQYTVKPEEFWQLLEKEDVKT